MESCNLSEEDLKSSPTAIQERNNDNQGITVTQLLTEFQQDARTPIGNPYASSNTPRRAATTKTYNKEVIIMVIKDLNFILPTTVVLYQKYREHIIAKRANVTGEAFLKNMHMKSAYMLTAEALVEEKNASAPISSKIIQDKMTHTLRVQKHKSDSEKQQERKKKKKTARFQDDQEMS
eukprot:6698446-Ditylum_brightwellii.AAC.1